MTSSEKVFSILRNAWAQNRLPHAMIFYGPEGVGEDRMSTCKYPFYVLMGIGFPIDEDTPGGEPDGPGCDLYCSAYPDTPYYRLF